MRLLMSGHVRRIVRFLSALPPEREDWLLIEPKEGLSVPIPDFHRAHHGRLSERRQGIPSAKEERRLIGPRLLLFAVAYPIIWLPVAYAATVVEVSTSRWRMLAPTQRLADLFFVRGHRNPFFISFLVLYAIYLAILAVRIILTQRKSNRAHYRIPRRDGAPSGLDHITPELIGEYLALGDQCYIIDAPERFCIRYREGHKTLELKCDELVNGGRYLAVHVGPHQPVWTDPDGKPIDAQHWSLILSRIKGAVRFAGYVPRLENETKVVTARPVQGQYFHE
jgi:hypothetical protein